MQDDHLNSALSSNPAGFYSSDCHTWVDQYLDDCALHLAPETVTTYKKKLATFVSWWRTHAHASPFTLKLALTYDSWLRTDWTIHGRPCTERSRGLYLSAVRQWAHYLVKQHQLQQNPFVQISVKRADWLVHGFLTFGDIKRLLQSFDHSQIEEFRDYLLMLLMLRTGAREGELSNATVGDVTSIGTEGLLTLNSKGKRRREPVLLRPDVKQKLDRYLAWRQQSRSLTPASPLFANVRTDDGVRMTPRHMRRRIKHAFQRVGLTQPNLSALSLRHAAAFQALLKKAPLSSVQMLMRHESIETTKVFERQLERVRRGGERYLDHLH